MSNPISSYTIETDTFNLPTVINPGYSFDGWTGSNGVELQTEVVIEKGSIGNRSYEAHWTANKLVTTYNVNGGRIAYSTNPYYGTDSTGLINYVSTGKTWTHTWTYNNTYTLSNHTAFGVEKPGYVFKGWCTDPNGSGTLYASLSTATPAQLSESVLAEKESTVVLYAIWEQASNVLITGERFNKTIVSGVTKTVFTDTQAPYGTTVKDLSAAGDKGIVGWVSNGTYYISSQRSGVKVKTNTNSGLMFYGNPNDPDGDGYYGNALWQNVTSHNLTNLDTSSATSFKSFFGYNYALTSITGVNNLNTANVTNMYCTFQYCKSLTSLTLTNWNTAKVTDMQTMFGYCTSLVTLNLSGWNVTKVKNMSYAISECSVIKTVNLSGWRPSSCLNMRDMFRKDYVLSSLTLGSYWASATGNVTNMYRMFYRCQSLTLNCKSWVVTKVTTYDQFNYDASGVTAPTWKN